MKHSWLQHWVVSQQIQHCFLTSPAVRVNQKSVKPHLIETTISHSAVDHCQSSVVAVQSYPSTGSQFIAIVVPRQSSEVVSDIIVCDPYLQCYVLRWHELHSTCTNSIKQIYIEISKRQGAKQQSNIEQVLQCAWLSLAIGCK